MSDKRRFPTVHMNGTSREMLVAGYSQAYEATRQAVDAMHSIELNARDYYVQGPAAFAEARTAFFQQLKALDEVKAYLMDHIRHLQS